MDEIQCAAARVVAAVRKHARERDPKGNPNGVFDTFHVRRKFFIYSVLFFPRKTTGLLLSAALYCGVCSANAFAFISFYL